MLDLVPDCGSCAAVCCVATSFDKSEDFAFSKSASVSCKHLTRAHRCNIHEQLVERGMRGCAIYDCYGAGQRATRMFPNAIDVDARNAAFLFLRVVHELLFQVTETAKLCPALADEAREIVAALNAVRLDDDLRPHRLRVNALLRRARPLVVLMCE